MNQCTGKLPQAPMQEAVSKEWAQHKSPSTDHGSTGRHATCTTRVIASGRHLSSQCRKDGHIESDCMAKKDWRD